MAASLTGPAKLAVVQDFMDKLALDLENVQFLPCDRDAILDELKLYGRDPTNADPIFTPQGIETLSRHAFHSPSSSTCHHAMRCLANAMLLVPSTRQHFVDLGYEADICMKLNSSNWESEFLCARIVFLTTYDTTTDLEVLVKKYSLAAYSVHNLTRHVKQLSSKSKADPMEEMALVETLKLIFNVTAHRPDLLGYFNHAVPHIISLLWKDNISLAKPLDPPGGQLINALLNLGLSGHVLAIFPKDNPNLVADRLIQFLENSFKVYQDAELEASVTPLVSVVRKVHKLAPATVKTHIREALLPTAEDRKNVLGKSQSLASCLLRNSNNPLTPSLRDVISNLLFDMSDNDSQKFVDNVGYGFASGLLFQKNLPVPKSASEAFSSSQDDSAHTTIQKPVNPITGQFLDAEKVLDIPDMSPAEKEREAERLFVLFERLKKNGLIDVQNPVEKALHEGRFEELDDDAADVD